MTLSWKRLSAIMQKEWKDFLRNAQVLVMVLMPVIFAFVFSKIPVDAGEEAEAYIFLVMPVLMALTMTGAFVQAMMIAEEKEKNTLRVLVLSPATSVEVLLGKSVLSFALTLLTIGGCVAVSGQTIGAPLLFFTMSILSVIVFVALGTVIGLISKSLQDTSITGLPIMFLFLMGPIFSPMLNIDWLTTVLNIFPTQHFMDGSEQLFQGGSFSDVKAHMLNIGIWMVGAFIVSFLVYRKKRFD